MGIEEESQYYSSFSTITDLQLQEEEEEEEDGTCSPISSPVSELKAELPIKRGLSKYYSGKSQSFTSLASVKAVEDLPKKENPLNVKMKNCRSYAGGLDGQAQQYMNPRCCTPKHRSISKSVSASSAFLSSMVAGRNDLLSNCARPPVPY